MTTLTACAALVAAGCLAACAEHGGPMFAVLSVLAMTAAGTLVWEER